MLYFNDSDFDNLALNLQTTMKLTLKTIQEIKNTVWPPQVGPLKVIILISIFQVFFIWREVWHSAGVSIRKIMSDSLCHKIIIVTKFNGQYRIATVHFH